MSKNKHHSSRKIEDHLGESGTLIEQNAIDAPVKDVKWEAQQMEVHSDVIKDPGKGDPLLLRTFEFKLNPNLPKELVFSKQDLFNYHQKQIEVLLWGDGLQAVNEIKKPKVQISKTQKKYRIFVLCKPVQTLLETPTIIT